LACARGGGGGRGPPHAGGRRGAAGEGTGPLGRPATTTAARGGEERADGMGLGLRLSDEKRRRPRKTMDIYLLNFRFNIYLFFH
jgi:hypothetical protein